MLKYARLAKLLRKLTGRPRMELVLDVKSFLQEVQMRPALWYTSCDEYKDRQLRRNHWREICEVIVPDFNEKNPLQQSQIERTLQAKWKNLRDAYIRSLRGRPFFRRLEDGTTTGIKHAKPYVYAKLMDFLKKNVELHGSSPRQNSVYNPFIKQEPVHEEFEELNEATEESMRPLTINISYSKANDRQAEDSLVDTGDSHSQNSNLDYSETREFSDCYGSRENDDEAFFRSLQPMLQTLTNHQKISFRIDVMKLLAGYIKKDNK